MLVFVMGMTLWGVMHACCTLSVPLVLTAPVVMLVVLLAALAQYCSDRVYTFARSAMLHVCVSRSKHAPYLLAVLTLSMCAMFPVASGGSAPSMCLLPFRTQFSTCHAVVASATSQINRVGVFNTFIHHRDPRDHDDTCNTASLWVLTLSLMCPSLTRP